MKKGISPRNVVVLSSILLLGVALPGVARPHGGGTTSCSGKTGQSFNVTSNILGSANDAFPFQLLSDGAGTYTTYSVKRDSATSEIQANTCDWLLDLSTSKSRTMRLSLAYKASDGAQLPSGWPTDGSLVSIPGLLRTNCGSGNPAFGLMTTAGQTIQCAMHVRFESGGTQYMFKMNPAVYDGTTWPQITCTGAASNQCNAWTITPPANVSNPSTGQNTGIGVLVIPPCDGCDGGTPIGLYYWDFSIVVTQP
jgi:hypothetical protein